MTKRDKKDCKKSRPRFQTTASAVDGVNTYHSSRKISTGSNDQPLHAEPPTHVPKNLRASPTYLAQQALKRRRNVDGIHHDHSTPIPFSHIKFSDDGYSTESSKSGYQDVRDQAEKEEVATKSEDQDEETSFEIGLLPGIAAFAGPEGEDQRERPAAYRSTSGSGSSTAASSRAFSISNSSSSANQDNETSAVDDDVNSSADETSPESPSKRLKRNHSTIFSEYAPEHRPQTSVATRNPPPPELEGQFKYTNSIVGSNIYRYPKAVLDSLVDLEAIIPRTVTKYVEDNPPDKTAKFLKRNEEGNEDTKRILVVLESARRVVMHLSYMKVESQQKEEAKMGEEMMRIARERGKEVEELRGIIQDLKAGIQDGKELRKRKRN